MMVLIIFGTGIGCEKCRISEIRKILENYEKFGKFENVCFEVFCRRFCNKR